MNFLVITYTPPRQGMLGVIASNVNIEEMTAESEQEAKDLISVPLGGYALIVAEEHVTTVTSQIVNEISEEPPSIETRQ